MSFRTISGDLKKSGTTKNPFVRTATTTATAASRMLSSCPQESSVYANFWTLGAAGDAPSTEEPVSIKKKKVMVLPSLTQQQQQIER